MKTIGEVLALSSDFLKNKGCSRGRRIAEELVAHVLELKRLDLYLQFDRPLQKEELVKVRSFLKRAATGEPLSYIFGEQEFYHCHLAINSHVLIPRQETEILIDKVCAQLQTEERNDLSAWDLCTGSGCLGIAFKKHQPQWQVTLSDLSQCALEVAKSNAQRNQVEVEVVCGDLLSPFHGRKAHLILCNPPYVSSEEYGCLDDSVRLFEPKGALLGGDDGLDFYRRLHQELPSYLEKGAKLFFEIGSEQGKALLTLFKEAFWKNVRVEKDWAGHDRFFFLEFE